VPFGAFPLKLIVLIPPAKLGAGLSLGILLGAGLSLGILLGEGLELGLPISSGHKLRNRIAPDVAKSITSLVT
jgi:hypothetical protein